jgi:hypothetical protein
MDELFPPPEPPAKAEKKDAEEQQSAAAILGDTVNKLSNPPSTLSRARGTVFLVDAKSKEVVWSTYEAPKDSSSRQMDRTANDIVSRLKRDLTRK